MVKGFPDAVGGGSQYCSQGFPPLSCPVPRFHIPAHASRSQCLLWEGLPAPPTDPELGMGLRQPMEMSHTEASTANKGDQGAEVRRRREQSRRCLKATRNACRTGCCCRQSPRVGVGFTAAPRVTAADGNRERCWPAETTGTSHRGEPGRDSHSSVKSERARHWLRAWHGVRARGREVGFLSRSDSSGAGSPGHRCSAQRESRPRRSGL